MIYSHLKVACLLQLSLVLIAVVGVVVYRAAVFAVFAAQPSYHVGAVSIATSATAALINLIIIMVLNKVYLLFALAHCYYTGIILKA